MTQKPNQENSFSHLIDQQCSQRVGVLVRTEQDRKVPYDGPGGYQVYITTWTGGSSNGRVCLALSREGALQLASILFTSAVNLTDYSQDGCEYPGKIV